MTTTTYKVRPERLDVLVADLTKLATRAAKLGVPVPTWTVSPLQTQLVRDNVGGVEVTKVRAWHDLTLVSEPVKLAGYTFVATLDHTSEAGVILRTVPGETVPVSYRDGSPVCDHCGLDRKRKETFVVRHDDGTHKQVGRQCLRDFLGVDPDGIAALAQYAVTIGARLGDEDAFGGQGGSKYFGLNEFLAWVAVDIRVNGWLSRKVAREQGRGATADAALNLLLDGVSEDLRKFRREHPVTEADLALVAASVEWARGLRENAVRELSDYEHNLFVVCSGEALTEKQAGIAASVISAYNRWLGRETEKRLRYAAEANSVHFGTVGKRETFTLTPVGHRSFDGNYGPRTLVTFRDANGNVATWWTGSLLSGWTIGETVTVKATVKDHSVYNGIKQTVLTRLTDVRDLKAAKPRKGNVAA